MKTKSVLVTLIKLAIGLALITVLVMRVQFSALFNTLRTVDGAIVTAAFSTYFLAALFEISKFRAACRFRIKWRTSLSLVETGLFFNNFLPSNIGGDAYKLYRLKSMGFDPLAALSFLLMDRFAGMLMLTSIGVCCWALTVSGKRVLSPAFLKQAVALNPEAATVIILAVLALIGLTLFLLRKRILQFMLKFENSIVSAVKYIGTASIPVLILAACFHLCRGIAIYLLSRAFGFSAPFPSIMVILACVLIVSMLPISLGGLGVREGTLSILLQQVGLPAETALAIALLNLAVLWSKSLIGSLIFLNTRHLRADHSTGIGVD